MRYSFGVIALALLVTPAHAGSFKVADVHFETNASACDMGIQLKFDTEGITEGIVRDPHGVPIYKFDVTKGMKDAGGQTEGFLEGVEPQIKELVDELGCGPTDEPVSTLKAIQSAFPAGEYSFHAEITSTKLDDTDELTYHIPAGPRITNPAKGEIIGSSLLVQWRSVTAAIIPSLGPITVTGYHVIVEPVGSESPPEFNVDLPASSTSVRVPSQFLHPATRYNLEVIATEESGNQTITEGFFCTLGVKRCVSD